MPGLTKKKKKVSSGPLVLKKPKAKISTRVKNFADTHKKELKALGWAVAPHGMAGKWVIDKAVERGQKRRKQRKSSSEYRYLGKKATTGKGR